MAADKFANLKFIQATDTEIERLTSLKPSGCAYACFLYLRLNIDVDTGILKTQVGDEVLNYNLISEKTGYHLANVRKSIKWLNKNGFINTYIQRQLMGKINKIT